MRLVIGLLMLLSCIKAASAIEIDGFKSGMTIQEAKELLEKYSYEFIDVKPSQIMAYDNPEKATSRFINLGFCKGKLARIEKHLKPRFDYFARLVEEKRKEFGRPADAWTHPAGPESIVESNSITLLWRNSTYFVTVTYTEFSSNNQLDVIYENTNKCWKTPY